MWIARPGLGDKDASRWLPPGQRADANPLPAAVFFIHPTSYLDKAAWNASPSEPKSRDLADTFVRGMASPFNASPDVWAPRYRQAAFGAFLTDDPQAGQAIERQTDKMANAVDDASLSASVKAALIKEPDLKTLGINVDSKDGTVVLKGEVKSMADKQRAEQVASTVSGVSRVDNQLQIVSG